MSLWELDGAGDEQPIQGVDVDVHWELDAQDDLMPLLHPLPLNYPAESVVLNGVVYGLNDMFEGQYICVGGGPAQPEIELEGVGADSVVVLVTPGAESNTVHVLYRRTYSGEAFTMGPSKTGTGFVTVPGLTTGLSYDFLAIAEEPTGAYSLPSELITAVPEPDGVASSVAAGFFETVFVDNLMEQGAIIYWTLGNIPCDEPGPYYFTAQWARTINGEWADVGAPAVVDGYYIIDPTKRLWAKQIDLYYRVRATTGAGTIYYSDAVRADGGLPRNDWLKAREITRKEYLRLVKYTGTEGELYRRRDWGDICPECTDYDTGERVKENCEVCWDTGYVGGYYPPVPFWIDLTEHQQRLQRDDSVGMRGDITMMSGTRAVPYPLPYSNDMWVSHEDGRRWFIQTVGVVAKVRNRPLVISPELRLIPASSILYRL